MAHTKYIENIKPHIIKLIKYGFFGGIGLLTDITIFTFTTIFLKFMPLFANTISVSAGILTSFYFNRKFTFKVFDKTLRRAIKFYAVGILGLILSNIIIYLSLTYLQTTGIVAKALSIPFVLIFQFGANSLWSFGK